MKATEQQWNQIRDEYLIKVKNTLQGASEQERQQILEELTFHLQKRFKELSPEEQTWENMQSIIIEMGPVEDYAALLEEKSVLQQTKRNPSIIFWITGCLIFALLLSFLSIYGYSMFEKYQQTKRPVVLQVSPDTLDRAVNPNLTEISVTFDQPMMNLSWSWVGGGEHFPETTGEPHYDKERKTCTLPVKLKPGHWYFVGINSEKYVYFQTEKHIPAKPYVILFATADENGNPTDIPSDYIEEAERVNSSQ